MLSIVFLIITELALSSTHECMNTETSPSPQECMKTPGLCPQVPVNRQFQLSQLEGTTYLVATSYEGTQDSCVKYELKRSREQELTGNKSFREGVSGHSETVPGSIKLKATGVLVVYFNEPDRPGTPEQHEVLLHDDDFVVLYGCTYDKSSDKNCLDILVFSKQQEISKYALNGVLKNMKDHGVNISNFKFVKQSGC